MTKKKPIKMTTATIPLFPASTTVSPPSAMSAAAANMDAENEAIEGQQQQQCRRCSFLFNGSFHLANSTLFGGNARGNATAVSPNDASESNSSNIFHQNQRRLSPPSSLSAAALFNASMMINGDNSSTGTMSSNSHPFIRLPPFFASAEGSGQHSRGENTLEMEALTAVHQFAIAVQSIAVSEILPRTPDLIFVNLTTLDGQPYCLELTAKGWRITSLRTDCMQGDFTQMDTFTHYYDSLHDLMDAISPGYRERFAEDFGRRFQGLVERMHGNQNENVCRHSFDCSSGQMSDCECSEEAAEQFSSANICTLCRKRLLSAAAGDFENGNVRHAAEHKDYALSLSSQLTNGNSLLCPKE